jgi:hypothetical protein
MPTVREVVDGMLLQGISSRVIAAVLHVDDEKVAELASADLGYLAIDDETLLSMHQNLTVEVYREMTRMMREGTPAQKIQVGKTVYALNARSMTMITPKEIDYFRAEFQAAIERGAMDNVGSDDSSDYEAAGEVGIDTPVGGANDSGQGDWGI